MLKAHIIKKRRELQVDVQLTLAQGRSVGLFGASGAGKSTVLACVAGIEEPDGGSVELKGLNLFPPSQTPDSGKGPGRLDRDSARALATGAAVECSRFLDLRRTSTASQSGTHAGTQTASGPARRALCRFGPPVSAGIDR